MSSPTSGIARRPWKASLALLLLLAAATASAEAARADGQASDCGAPLTDLSSAVELEPLCARNPLFLHRYGKLLNAAHRFADAAERLEAALLFDPDRWPAQVDFAVALEGLGDLASANGVWAALAENPAAQTWFAEHRARRERSRASWLNNQQNTFGLAVGYDDNLLGATRYTNLNLTFPTVVIPVEIDKGAQAQGGRFVRLDLGRTGDLYSDAKSRWSYTLFGSHSASIDYRPGNLSHLGTRIERAPEGAYGWYGIGLVQYQYRGTHASTAQAYLGGGYEHDVNPFGLRCRLRLGGEAYATHYPDSAMLDGRYAGVLAHGVCPGARIQYQLRAGTDTPADGTRPGGAQQRYGVRLAHVAAVAGGWLSSEIDLFHQADRKGYSPLLENNARRSLTRVIGRLEYRWAKPRYTPYVGVEWMDQHSNLPLFAPRNWIVTAGIRHAW